MILKYPKVHLEFTRVGKAPGNLTLEKMGWAYSTGGNWPEFENGAKRCLGTVSVLSWTTSTNPTWFSENVTCVTYCLLWIRAQTLQSYILEDWEPANELCREKSLRYHVMAIKQFIFTSANYSNILQLTIHARQSLTASLDPTAIWLASSLVN